MSQNLPCSSRNCILARLGAADYRLLESDLEAVDLPLRKVLERSQRRVENVYFPESGFASVVANGSGKKAIEVGIIGREGMTGLAVVLGGDRPHHETYIQIAGDGQRLKASALRKALEESSSLHRSLLRYAHSFLIQTARTALANGRSTIEERLARWLLMANDRIDGEELPLTQEFLAIMLGVTRPGVTVAVQEFERDGLIARKRGSLVILDREALRLRSNGAYHSADYQ
jgi:CRP-like cAMP-binding protein